MYNLSRLSALILCLCSYPILAADVDQVKVHSLICESADSYNQSVIVAMKNQLAAMKGTREIDNPKDCLFVESEPLTVIFLEYSGGSAIVAEGEKTLYTNRENIILGEKAAAEQESIDKCLKPVLEKYCLGDDESNLPEPNSKNGNTYVYVDGNNKIVVTLADARLATVSIFYPRPSWLNYRILMGQLEEKYGPGVNFDSFPSYANSDSAKATAITLGKGRALTMWHQTGWSIKYGWASDDWRILEYSHNELLNQLEKENAELL